VTIQGEVVKFDPAEIAKRSKTYKLDLSPEQIAKYQGLPAIFATSVISPAMVDLAKRVLPPPTAAELDAPGGKVRRSAWRAEHVASRA